MSRKNQIYGLRTIIEAIHAGKTIDKIFIQKGLRSNLVAELYSLIKKENINFSYVPIEKLNRLTNQNHQGVVASISPIDFYKLENIILQTIESGKNPLFLLLDQISDVRNFGAIIRTAACTGVDAIIIPKSGNAPITADTVKTSAGAVFNVPICKVDHLKDAVYYLQASGIKVIAATEKATNSVYETSFKESVAIIMGAEDKGITSSLLKITDKQAKLPLLGEIASLNVSVACGVFLYEVIRQRSND